MTRNEVNASIDALRSFAVFLGRYVYTDEGAGRKWDPWPWQFGLARKVQHTDRLIVLKARQIMMSWFAAAYTMWVCFDPGSHVLILSQTEDDAKLLLRRVRFIYDSLPDFLRPKLGASNLSTLEFPGLRSRIDALPSTRRAGRGITARLVVADEWAFHQWAADNFAALQPTIDAGGQILGLSTANGAGNTFHQLWEMAGKVGSDWERLFLGWDRHPNRDQAWYDRQAANYPREHMIHAEFPRNAEESFVQTGRPVFAQDVLDGHLALCSPAIDPPLWPSFEGVYDFDAEDMQVFALPIDGHRYFAGADVAEGLIHGDFSDLVLFDADTDPPSEVLSLNGHWPPDVFGAYIAAISTVYPGVYGIENNNHGLTTIVAARDRGAAGLYRQQAILDKAGEVLKPGKLGWTSDRNTKPLCIDEWSGALRNYAVKLNDRNFHPEHLFYATNDDGSTGAPNGLWDDRVMSRAIAWQMRKHIPSDVVAPPRREKPEMFAPSLRTQF